MAFGFLKKIVAAVTGRKPSGQKGGKGQQGGAQQQKNGRGKHGKRGRHGNGVQNAQQKGQQCHDH